MKHNYNIHDNQYAEARRNGSPGWGGSKRLKNGQVLIDRLFSCKETPTQGKVLELGCGEGNVSRLLYKKGFDVTGIDVSKVAVDWAKEKAEALKYNMKFFQMDLTEVGVLKDMEYDLIVDGNCLHCILGEDRVIFLENVYNALTKDGIFFVSSLCSKGDEDETIYNDDEPYRHVGTESSIAKELSNANFKLIKKHVYSRDEYNHICIHAVRVV